MIKPPDFSKDINDFEKLVGKYLKKFRGMSPKETGDIVLLFLIGFEKGWKDALNAGGSTLIVAHRYLQLELNKNTIMANAEKFGVGIGSLVSMTGWLYDQLLLQPDIFISCIKIANSKGFGSFIRDKLVILESNVTKEIRHFNDTGNKSAADSLFRHWLIFTRKLYKELKIKLGWFK